jgi:hypothetical protein
MNIRRVGVSLFHADGRTDMTRLISLLQNSFYRANSVKNPKCRVFISQYI